MAADINQVVMKNLIIALFLLFAFIGCHQKEICTPAFTNSVGNPVLQCCDDGMFREATMCKCINKYNKENGTNYIWTGHCGN